VKRLKISQARRSGGGKTKETRKVEQAVGEKLDLGFKRKLNLASKHSSYPFIRASFYFCFFDHI